MYDSLRAIFAQYCRVSAQGSAFYSRIAYYWQRAKAPRQTTDETSPTRYERAISGKFLTSIAGFIARGVVRSVTHRSGWYDMGTVNNNWLEI
jgi:hypothetical protein